jgi:ATP-dependent Clp protease ATP-binding subunit ClpC
MWTGIPVFKLTEASPRASRMEDEPHKRVIGQEEGSRPSRARSAARAGISDPKRPTGSFIFLGPSGVEAELARTLAEFCSATRTMIQVDMSEYMEKHSVSCLVGSPPGYIGYDEGGQLRGRAPQAVLRASARRDRRPIGVFTSCSRSWRREAHGRSGRRVDFRNTIIVMTSNIGAARSRRTSRSASRWATTAA